MGCGRGLCYRTLGVGGGWSPQGLFRGAQSAGVRPPPHTMEGPQRGGRGEKEEEEEEEGGLRLRCSRCCSAAAPVRPRPAGQRPRATGNRSPRRVSAASGRRPPGSVAGPQVPRQRGSAGCPPSLGALPHLAAERLENGMGTEKCKRKG